MTKTVWIELSARERTLLLDGMSALRKASRHRTAAIDAMTVKLVHADPHPDITVGVHGGQVQWMLGNPFPVRICDYDGDDNDLPDIDERGQRCRMWFEPIDSEIKT